jgi:thiol-disulfide isomerase/thioredoxin
MKSLLASLCVVATLLVVLGCEPVSPTPPGPIPCSTVVIAFSAPGCSGCIKDKPRVDALERQGYTVVRVNIQADPERARRYGVTAVPVYIVVRCGKVVVKTPNLDLAIQMLR